MAYLAKSNKHPLVVQVIEQAIEILAAVGIPLASKTPRALEKMAMTFLAVAGVTHSWATAQGLVEKRFLKTRAIIAFINTHFEENISSGSYDDIRRKDLKLLVLAGLILNSAENPNAATNDPTRGYALAPDFTNLIRSYGTDAWSANVQAFLQDKTALSALLDRRRDLEKVPVVLPGGKQLQLSAGQHNKLQKLVVEEFLPRFGQGCVVLYIGDTVDKFLYHETEQLARLDFFALAHEELPDIIAYDSSRNWLYLIEVVHSSGSINEVRRLELVRLTQNCQANIIYVTAFLTKAEFRKWATEIAWETEVWIAENPDHLITL